MLLLEADPEAHFVESCGDTAWHLQLIDARSRLSSWLDGATNSLAFRQLTRPVGAVAGSSSDLNPSPNPSSNPSPNPNPEP